MKKILALAFSIVAFSVQSAVWTFHAAPGVGILDVRWNDWYAEITYGVCDGMWHPGVGWFASTWDRDYQFVQSDTVVLDSDNWFWPNPVPIWGTTLSGWNPGDDWHSIFQVGNDVSITDDGGEFWLDFDSAQQPRASTAQPSDFGKWAWDGSVNPSWVEPLAKKGHGKGHK